MKLFRITYLQFGQFCEGVIEASDWFPLAQRLDGGCYLNNDHLVTWNEIMRIELIPQS